MCIIEKLLSIQVLCELSYIAVVPDEIVRACAWCVVQWCVDEREKTRNGGMKCQILVLRVQIVCHYGRALPS